jgi:hypothetical protein
VTVGAKVDFSLPATTTGDEYQNTIVVTAVANDVSFLAPYIDLIIPASDYYTGGATIGIKGTNLDTAYQVFIDLNGDGEQDSDEECINANIESSILITCDVQAVDKSYASISTMYPVVVKTWGGTYTKTIGFKYVFPPATVTGISPDNSPVLTSTPVTIYGTGFTGGSGVDYVNFTFADDTHQECTNITVISDTELTCITPPSVVAGAAKFFVHVNLVAGGGNSDTNGVYFTYTAPTCRNADPTSVCVADLDPAMIPVKYTGTTSVPEWQIADPDTAGDWYDYNQKQWANAVTVKASGTQTRQNYLDAAAGTVVDPADVLSYYVYIPRYRYKIWTTTWRATNYPTAITIGFENCASDGNTCQTADYDKAEVSEVVAKLPNPLGTPLTHPAFTFNDHELNGIWVGKYESTNTAAVPRALPNIAQLSNVTIGAMFNGAKNAVATSNEQGLAATETDTRILNSDDWGAIAYLSQSIYGVCTNANCSVSGNPITTISPALSETQKIWNNGVSTCGGGGGRTGYGSGGKSDGCSGNVYNANNIWYSANGMLASSNHNSTGIYDLAGGVWEYTLDVYNMDLNSAASDISVFDAKYMNSYTNPPLTNSANDIFNGNYNLTSTFTAALGQAVFEVGGTASLTGAWNGDHSRSATSSNPWSDHGGQGTNETPAGLFAAGSAGGGGDLGIGSRLLLSRP